MKNLSVDQKLRMLAGFQGVFYVATGVWPLLHAESFLRVTGPKTDLWLVKTVGLLIAVAGAIFLDSAIRKSFPLQVIFLAVGMASALAAIDISYTAMGTISPIYLYDALVEIGIAAVWVITTLPERSRFTQDGTL